MEKIFSFVLVTALFIAIALNITPQAQAHTGACPDINLWIENTSIIDHPSLKYPIPVNTSFIMQIEVPNNQLVGNQVTFTSYNPWLTLVGDGHISDNGVSTGSTNFKIVWPKGNDGHLAFTVKVLNSNLIPGVLTRGYLMTVGNRVEGGKCGAKLELFGIPSY